MDNLTKTTIVADWEIEVSTGEPQAGDPSVRLLQPVRLQVEPSPLQQINAETIPSLPLFDPASPGWLKGERLPGVRTQETTARFLLDPGSLEVRSAGQISVRYLPNADYAADLDWGTLGRLPGGRIPEGRPVLVSYRHGLSRLDTVVFSPTGQVSIMQGVPHIATPNPPDLPPGVKALCNLWLPGRLSRLRPENLFPILEGPEEGLIHGGAVDLSERLPVTVNKLKSGGRLRILAWGDSVTDGGYLPDPAAERWQTQFAARLRERFPRAEIELMTEAWPGQNTSGYLAQPPGSSYNYQEKVLGAAPDLVISEFVNDAWLSPQGVEQQYSRFLADFRERGVEWIILTPHYVRPDWMDLDREIEVDEDPRPYVHGLRQFVNIHSRGVALADASRHWGRLWRQGLPYTTLLCNAINHPDRRGMKLFADSLVELLEGL